LGIGDWGLGPIPNPQSPIPNPHPQKKILFNSKRKNKQLILFGGKKIQFHPNSNINQKI
jgi:hypothetical protein